MQYAEPGPSGLVNGRKNGHDSGWEDQESYNHSPDIVPMEEMEKVNLILLTKSIEQKREPKKHNQHVNKSN